MERIETSLEQLRRVNRMLALGVGLLLIGCVCFVLLDIVLRQVGTSLGGSEEISGYVMAISTAWGMGFALMEMGHVRIDFLRTRLNMRGRAVLDLVAMLALALTVSLIALRAWPVLSRSLANGSRANTPLETPLAWVQMPWFAGWIWFAMSAWLTFMLAVLLIVKTGASRVETVIGTEGELEGLK